MMRALAAVFSLLLCVCPLFAAEGDVPVSRRVLALFNSSYVAHGEPVNTSIHTLLEKPLNHMGFMVDYHDVNAGALPDAEPYHAIIVWLESPVMPNPDRFLPWLSSAMRSGKKVILPSGLQIPASSDGYEVPFDRLLAFFQQFGLEQTGIVRLGEDADKLATVNMFPEKFGFETDLVRFSNVSPVYAVNPEKLEAWQYVEKVDDPAQRAVTVAAGPSGGWALEENFLVYTVDIEGEDYRVAWNVDPFQFLGEAVDSQDMPAPDVTTFWGTRGAFSHVDADGPYNYTNGYTGKPRYTFDMIYDEVLSKYHFPITIGYIACEYQPDIDARIIEPGESVEEALARPRRPWQGTQAEVAHDMREIAKKVSALPHIQSGCHSYSHPLDWQGKEPGYAIRDYEFSYEQETRGAIEYLNKNVLPPEKPVELFQWPGDCDPPPVALDILAEMNMANINGGDPLFDGKYNSVYFICPLTRPKGDHLQIHTAGSNENIYTVGWTAFHSAFNNVIATFEHSEYPKRFLPVNIYYHVFPAESEAGLRAMQNAYDWALTKELCWMRAVEYVHAVEGYSTARLGRTRDGGWWIEDYGLCPSLRFDNADALQVDIENCVNVAGYSRHAGSLYVALIPGERAEVRFGETPADSPCLAGSSGMLRNIVMTDKSWQAESRVWNDGFLDIWAGEGDWRGYYRVAGGERVEQKPRRLADGRLRIDLPRSDGEWVEVSFEL